MPRIAFVFHCLHPLLQGRLITHRARTTPALFGLLSLVTLLAHDQFQHQTAPPICQAAWYTKSTPTFADALAEVRR